jgi:hypothetical protein
MMKWWHFAAAGAAVFVSYKIGCRMGAAKAIAACGCQGITKPIVTQADAARAAMAGGVEVLREPSPDAIRAVGL